MEPGTSGEGLSTPTTRLSVNLNQHTCGKRITCACWRLWGRCCEINVLLARGLFCKAIAAWAAAPDWVIKNLNLEKNCHYADSLLFKPNNLLKRLGTKIVKQLANKCYSSAGHHKQKNKKSTSQIKFSTVTIKKQTKLVLQHSYVNIVNVNVLFQMLLLHSFIDIISCLIKKCMDYDRVHMWYFFQVQF